MTQRGISESLQWAILMPLVLLTLLGTIQAGIWLYGRTVVHNAAVLAAEQAAWLSETSDPRTSATRLAESGGVSGIEVRLTESPHQVRAVVTGRVPLFFDVGQSTVEASATRPRERVSVP